MNTTYLSSLLHRHRINAYRFVSVLNFPAQGLPLLLGDENKVSLLGLGALEPLCQLITHVNKLVRRNAVMALGIMANSGMLDNIQN